MYPPLTISSREAGRAFEQFGDVFGNGPDLTDPMPHQAALSGPELSDFRATKPVLTRNVSNRNAIGKGGVLVIPHTAHTNTDISNDRINEANLSFRGLQNSAPSLSERDSQFNNSAPGLLLAFYEGYSAKSAPNETFTCSITHPAIIEPEEPIELVDQPKPSIAFSLAPAPLAVECPEPRTKMEIPEMLSRFLKVDRFNDSLRYEAGIAISEGRVQEGEDIVKRKILEEDWKWNIDPLPITAMALDTCCEWSNSVEKDGLEDSVVHAGRYLEDSRLGSTEELQLEMEIEGGRLPSQFCFCYDSWRSFVVPQNL